MKIFYVPSFRAWATNPITFVRPLSVKMALICNSGLEVGLGLGLGLGSGIGLGSGLGLGLAFCH